MDALVRCAQEVYGLLAGRQTEAASARLAGVAVSVESAEFKFYPRSVIRQPKRLFFMVRIGSEKLLIVLVPGELLQPAPPDVRGTEAGRILDGAATMIACPCSNANALYLQQEVEHLRPSINRGCPGLGAGDRIGLSTPGHVRALGASDYFPLFAQQSIREMDRTGRTPEDVMATAVWGIVEEGYSGEWGADADHLKTADDIERVAPYAYTMFTLDPSSVIVNPDALGHDELRAAYERLPWAILRSSPDKLLAKHGGVAGTFSDHRRTHTAELAFDEASVVRCAVKYSAGIAHCLELARLVEAKRGTGFDLEVSFDETDWPTSPLEHLFIASEFRRLEMRVDSLALRFPGAFEKGIDYKGDLAVFERAFALHAAIRDAFCMYRLSIHSGSDKFTVYPIMTRYAGEALHVKTAGTTYLEALRVAARRDPDLFGEILAFSHARYEQDRRTYHVSADLSRMPQPDQIAANEYGALLEDDRWRQVLHVAFGSVLTSGPDHSFRARLCAMLAANEEDFYATVEKHFRKHLGALAAGK